MRHKDNTTPPEEFEFLVLPKHDQKPPGADDAGEIHITLSGTPEETKSKAYLIAAQVKEQMTFPSGRIQIHGGMIVGTKIPETPEEVAETGDKLHWVTLQFEEARKPDEFDPSRLTSTTLPPDLGILIEQFNAAKMLEQPVEAYLALFKIVEKAFADGRTKGLSRALLSNQRFTDLLSEIAIIDNPDSPDAVKAQHKKIVAQYLRVRDNCAHLRGRTGYLPHDRRIETELVPCLNFLRVFVHEFLTRRLNQESHRPG